MSSRGTPGVQANRMAQWRIGPAQCRKTLTILWCTISAYQTALRRNPAADYNDTTCWLPQPWRRLNVSTSPSELPPVAQHLPPAAACRYTSPHAAHIPQVRAPGRPPPQPLVFAAAQQQPRRPHSNSSSTAGACSGAAAGGRRRQLQRRRRRPLLRRQQRINGLSARWRPSSPTAPACPSRE